MRASDFLSEDSYFDSNINLILRSKGYKYLDSGVDQLVYLAPDGTILKIFGTKYRSANSPLELTNSQETFKAFADYCNEHPNNEFLPQFSDWATFEVRDRLYLQIKMERLFPIDDHQLTRALADLADYAEYANSPDIKNKFNNPSKDERQKLMLHLGEDGFNKLWNTIFDLSRIAKSRKARIDLHGGNFMFGSDGHIVINDPFFQD